MINALHVCDNHDPIMGDFFNKCSVATEQYINSSNDEINCNKVHGNSAFEVAVPMHANNMNDKPFLFVSYTHGTETELLKQGSVPFLSIDANIDMLKNSFSYCYACKSGKSLGPAMCANGTFCFIGYKENVTIQKYFGAEDAFVECAVTGIKSLLAGKTTGQILYSIKEKYTEFVDVFYVKDMLTATLFMQNRDALVLHGNSELSIYNLML